RRPGGWPSMRILHENAPPVDFLDRLALRASPLSLATRNRRKLVVLMLGKILEGLRDQPFLNLLGIGAGPGWHFQDALIAVGRDPSSFRIVLVDQDPTAPEIALLEARKRGLESAVHCITGDARSIGQLMPQIAPDVVKMIGLIEYLDDDELVQLLRSLRSVMAPGSQLLTHGFVDRFRQAPFLARTFGLRHHARSAARLQALLADCGFQTVETRVTPLGIFPVCHARRV
ncbi:MAG TPA: class I SAM-dependent methyltransferase family protein, partial [Pirellulaceae bacterium]